MDDLKQECIEATTIWRMAGCPRNGDINSSRIKIKLWYKNAVKEAAREGESQLVGCIGLLASWSSSVSIT